MAGGASRTLPMCLAVGAEKPYLTLEDGRLDGAALMSEVVNPPGADQSHVIIDACQAYLLAFQRGPGGERQVDWRRT